MKLKPQLKQSLEIIKQRKPDFNPRVGIILGSGLAGFTETLEDTTVIPFGHLPGFPVSHVEGHEKKMILGYLSGVPVVCLKGRAHYYENHDVEGLKLLIRTLKRLGCETLIVTNASGSTRKDLNPGEIVLITDHINLAFFNPLTGPNDDEFGPRFVPMADAYTPALRDKVHETAKSLNIPLHDGVYLGVSGPSFETAAEIKAYRTLGADMVGMSTVADVIVARHCGMRIIGLSGVVNLGAGLRTESLSHEETLTQGPCCGEKLIKLIPKFLERYKNEFC